MIYFILLGTVSLVVGYFYGLYNIKKFFKLNFYDSQKNTIKNIEWHNLKYKELEERLCDIFEKMNGLKKEEPVDCAVKKEKPKYNVSDYRKIYVRPMAVTTFGVDDYKPYSKFFVQFVFENNDKDYDTRFNSKQKIIEAYNFTPDKERFTDVILWLLGKFDDPKAAAKLLDIDVTYLKNNFNYRQISEVLKEYFTVNFEEVISTLENINK